MSASGRGGVEETGEAAESERRDHPREPLGVPVPLLRGERTGLARSEYFATAGAAVARPPGCDLVAKEPMPPLSPIRPGPAAVSARVARIDAAAIGCAYHEPQPVPPCPAGQRR